MLTKPRPNEIPIAVPSNLLSTCYKSYKNQAMQYLGILIIIVQVVNLSIDGPV